MSVKKIKDQVAIRKETSFYLYKNLIGRKYLIKETYCKENIALNINNDEDCDLCVILCEFSG